MKSILHISTINEWRGGDKQMLTTHQLLKDYQEFKQVILCASGSALEEKSTALGAKVYSAPRKSKFSLAFFKKIIEVVKKEKIDILHVHDSNALSLSLLAIRFLPGKKIVYSRKRNNKVKDNYFKRIKYNNPKIERIICVSEAVKKVLLPVLNNPDKAEVIYDGIDVAYVSSKRNEGLLKKEYNLKENSIKIGNIAGLTRQKDLFTFLNSAKIILNNSVRDINFFIIGDGNLRSELEAYAKDLQIFENVKFMGFREDAVAFLPELDIFMLSSETEGLPLSIYEAFASNVPVVATAAGGTGEAVKHEVTGLLSPVKDPEALAQNVLRLLEDKVLTEKLKSNAYQLVHEKYTLGEMKKNYFKLYNSIDVAP